MMGRAKGLPFDAELLRQFESALDPRQPEQGDIPARVLGYGEISTVLEIGPPGPDNRFACKRMPLFRSEQEVTDYIALYHDYNTRLRELGINVPASDTFHMPLPGGRTHVFYGIQEKVPYASIGNRVIHAVSKDEVGVLIRMVLLACRPLFRQNRQLAGMLELAVDGQISNWALPGFDPDRPRITPDMELVFIDTSTPLMRQHGRERLNPELFLRAAPSFLVWIIRLLFLKDVMSRYYDFRLVIIDLVANFYKEQRADLVPYAIAVVNDCLADELREFDLAPLTEAEIRRYYREDALIWRFYLAARRADRWLHQALRRPYPYILPKVTAR